MFEREDETFNGWANWDTWNAHLWITNEEWSYYSARDTTGPEDLKRWVHAAGLTGDGFDPDEVDWTAVWKGIVDDTTALHGAGTCDADTCEECREDARCPDCEREWVPVITSRLTGEATRRCECGCTFI